MVCLAQRGHSVNRTDCKQSGFALQGRLPTGRRQPPISASQGSQRVPRNASDLNPHLPDPYVPPLGTRVVPDHPPASPYPVLKKAVLCSPEWPGRGNPLSSLQRKEEGAWGCCPGPAWPQQCQGNPTRAPTWACRSAELGPRVGGCPSPRGQQVALESRGSGQSPGSGPPPIPGASVPASPGGQ